jgi:hypothetical protein
MFSIGSIRFGSAFRTNRSSSPPPYGRRRRRVGPVAIGRLIRSRSSGADVAQEYWDTKDVISRKEAHILRALGFHTHVDHPHKYLLSYLKMLGIEQRNPMAQVSWNYLSDRYDDTADARHARVVGREGQVTSE